MARFIGVDREQVFLLPPSVCDWVPDAKARLQRQRQPATEAGGDEDDDRVEIDLDPRHLVTPPQGRRAWLREGRRALEAQRERQRRPIPNDRAERLFEACRRLERELDASRAGLELVLAMDGQQVPRVLAILAPPSA